MQSLAASTPPSVAPSFAGMLAEAAQPEKKFPPVRDLDGLDDDLATLSYESALRAHYRAERAEQEQIDALSMQEMPEDQAIPAQQLAEERASQAATDSNAGEHADPSRKSASVTIRMSQPECEQLRERAAEAGLTVSAYLRSCAFEVETLRAQVKQTLAELRAATTAHTQPQPQPQPQSQAHAERIAAQHRGWTRWWGKLVPHNRKRAA